MIFNCILVLAVAVFGASAMVSTGYGAAGFGGMHGMYGGYGGTVADTCHCVKTVVRPHIGIGGVGRLVGAGVGSVVERIPYSVSRRVDAPGYGAGHIGGAYGAGLVGGAGLACGAGMAGAGYGLGYGTGVY